MRSKGVKRLLLAMAFGLVMTPVALGVGLVLLITTFDDDGNSNVGNPLGGLRIGGNDGVPSEYAPLILKSAADCDQGLSPAVLAAQLKQESGFDPTASSGVGAQGIAQFMPGTWATWGVDGNDDGKKNVWDPEDAIPAQGKFMCSLLRQAKQHPDYDGAPIELALAGYNAGFQRVVQFKGVPPKSFAGGQTYYYVQNIMAMSAAFAAPAASEGGSLPAGYELPPDTPPQVRIAVAWALRQKGGWYHLGGDCTDALGKNPAHWCDCSSLMQQAYKAAGIDIPRVTYEQVHVGTAVDMDHPKPGDLVFNPGLDGSDASPGHVAMYIGDGLLIEAPHTGVKTRIVTYSSWRNSTSYMTRITAVRRVVN